MGKLSSLLEVCTGFNGELTGRENIYRNGVILSMKKRQIDRKIDEMINFSEIEHYIDTSIKRYSSGMYVRLAFAVAAHLDSEILIADEVLAVGDAAFQKKALGKMNDLSTGQGKTVLFVSHQMGAISNLCNKGIVLDSGRIAMQDNIERCIDYYMTSGLGQSTPGYWEGVEGDLSMRIYRAFISPSNDPGNIITGYRKGKLFYLHVDYEIFRPQQNYLLSVEIFNKAGIQLCVNSATDFFKDATLQDVTSPGKHSIQLKIDTSIFANGEYLIKFDFAIHNVKRILHDTPCLRFEVFTKDANITQSAPERSNIIYPEWSWTI